MYAPLQTNASAEAHCGPIGFYEQAVDHVWNLALKQKLYDWRIIMVYGNGAGVIKSSYIDKKEGIHNWLPPTGDDDAISHVLPLTLYVRYSIGYTSRRRARLKILLGEPQVDHKFSQYDKQKTAANIAHEIISDQTKVSQLARLHTLLTDRGMGTMLYNGKHMGSGIAYSPYKTLRDKYITSLVSRMMWWAKPGDINTRMFWTVKSQIAI